MTTGVDAQTARLYGPDPRRCADQDSVQRFIIGVPLPAALGKRDAVVDHRKPFHGARADGKRTSLRQVTLERWTPIEFLVTHDLDGLDSDGPRVVQAILVNLVHVHNPRDDRRFAK
jgi:hypothetical protein